MAHVIAVVHAAGGVGKTTTTLNLGYTLALAGQRVLLVDLDPQSDLSGRLGLDTAPAAGMHLALRGATPPPVLPTAHGFDLAAADPLEMAGIELLLGGLLARREDQLRKALAPLRPAYDYILIDCPPTLSLLTVNALYAADSVLVPVQAHPKAYRLLRPLWAAIRATRSNLDGDHPSVLGVLLTMTEDTLASREVEATARAALGAAVFTVTIPKRTKLTQDSAYGGPVGWYAPKNGAAAAYTALAEEVLSRAP